MIAPFPALERTGHYNMEAPMHFVIRYRMSSGEGRRQVRTASEVLAARTEILLAGGSHFVITDHEGKELTLEQLALLLPNEQPKS